MRKDKLEKPSTNDKQAANKPELPIEGDHKESKDTDKQNLFKKFFKSKKVMGISILVIALIVGLIAFAVTRDDDGQGDQSGDMAQSDINLASAIALTEGTVQYGFDGENWQDAEGGETISAGEYVRTLEDSRAVVALDDGSVVRLDENSQIKLESSDVEASEVRLVEGQIYSRVIESDTRTFSVLTNTERFEALGTAFKTKMDEDKDSLEVYQSKVKVESEELDVDEGNKYDTKSKKQTSLDLNEVKNDDFIKWNIGQDKKDENFKNKLGVLKDEAPSDDSGSAGSSSSAGGGLSLSGSKTDNGVYLSWANSGVSAGDGFKIVYSKSDTTPTYKKDTSQFVSAGKTDAVVKLTDGKTYYFRICAYRASAGSCDSYSNTVTVTAPSVSVEAVQAGAVSLSINDDVISWSIGGTAPHGFKVLLGNSTGPTYPSNSIQYVDKNTTSTTLPDKPAGTYYIRVCKYTADSNINGGCTDYSNEVQYIVN